MENKEKTIPEIEPKKKSNAGKIFLGILILVGILIGGYYLESNYEDKIFKNKTIEEEICYNGTELNYSYLYGAAEMSDYMRFYLVNESYYCNTIPISWEDFDKQTYTINLISINCLKGGNN